jgi:hypothetical protein
VPSARIPRATAQAHLLRGLALERLGEAEEARSSWARAASLLGAEAERSRDPSTLDPWARAWIHLERPDRVRPILAKLAAIGYREPGFVRLCEERGLAPALLESPAPENST